MKPRFEECPLCKSKDLDKTEDIWFCYDCDWEVELTQEEKDARESGE